VKNIPDNQQTNKPFGNNGHPHRRPFSNATEKAEGAGFVSPDVGSSLPLASPVDRSPGGTDAESALKTIKSLPVYTITNLTTDRTYNANATSVGELADVVGTLIGDIQKVLNDITKRVSNA